MADVSQGETGHPMTLEDHKLQDNDDDNDVIICGSRPNVGAGGSRNNDNKGMDDGKPDSHADNNEKDPNCQWD